MFDQLLTQIPTLNDAQAWQVVVARDRSFDGQFFYSVSTTGIYCRPACPARLAKREHVAFHVSCSEAEAAGFRACKRCRPQAAPRALEQAELIASACRAIESAESAPTLSELAQAARLSTFHFHRLFKSTTGVTPKAYAMAQLRGRVQHELSRAQSVSAAIYDAGYNSSGRFYANATQMLGMRPRAFRAGGDSNTLIQFAIAPCSLGHVLVAGTAAGICAILLGSDPAALIADLHARFAQAQLADAAAGFKQNISAVVALVEAPQAGHNLPLEVRGTAFQMRVWQQLQRIPAGSTCSYAALAQSLGTPGAARAVAGACAANPLAVAIPCHRVVRADGALSGYRWGVERKRELLRREAVDLDPTSAEARG